MPRPDLAAVPDFYHGYVNKVQENDVCSAIAANTSAASSVFYSIPEDKWDYRYAENKWTVKDLLQHIIDAERVFAYRALRFARKDATPLPGFDEQLFANNSGAERRDSMQLLEEFAVVRKSTELLYQSFSEDQLNATGTANNNPVSVLAIGFIIAGHVQHHLDMLQERYL